MSLSLQLKRGLLALPVAGLLIFAGAIAPAGAAVETRDCAVAVKQDAPALQRRVDFRSMLPGALNVLRRVEVPVGKG